MLKFIILLSAASVGSATSTFIKASDPNMQYIGRFNPAGTAMQFDMPGCEIRSRVTLSATSSITASLSQKHQAPPNPAGGNSKNSGFESNAFVVFVNGVRQAANQDVASFTTANVTDEVPHDYAISSSLAAGTYDIKIFKTTEADWNGGDPVPNYVTFYGFTVKPLSSAPVPAAVDSAGAAAVQVEQAPPLPTRKIEFLGDSITAGFCNECQTEAVLAGGHREAFGRSWDQQICKTLDAQCHTAAWSGLGMVKNCCGGNTTMPSIFNRTLATDSATVWDWTQWKADALVINLGTNDGGAVHDPQYHYVDTYTDVVMQASRHYGPDLNVFLACGPMSSGYCDAVHTVISNVQPHGVKAHFLDHTDFLNGTFGPACCGHPSIQVDTAMAAYGSAQIKAALGWQ